VSASLASTYPSVVGGVPSMMMRHLLVFLLIQLSYAGAIQIATELDGSRWPEMVTKMVTNSAPLSGVVTNALAAGRRLKSPR
jgi:hypothetical protein